jgi:hypothetical protein
MSLTEKVGFGAGRIIQAEKVHKKTKKQKTKKTVRNLKNHFLANIVLFWFDIKSTTSCQYIPLIIFISLLTPSTRTQFPHFSPKSLLPSLKKSHQLLPSVPYLPHSIHNVICF